MFKLLKFDPSCDEPGAQKEWLIEHLRVSTMGIWSTMTINTRLSDWWRKVAHISQNLRVICNHDQNEGAEMIEKMGLMVKLHGAITDDSDSFINRTHHAKAFWLYNGDKNETIAAVGSCNFGSRYEYFELMTVSDEKSFCADVFNTLNSWWETSVDPADALKAPDSEKYYPRVVEPRQPQEGDTPF